MESIAVGQDIFTRSKFIYLFNSNVYCVRKDENETDS